MNTSTKKIAEENDNKSSGKTLDPFAVDFFGVKDSAKKAQPENVGKDLSSNDKKPTRSKKTKSHWHEKLPKFTYREVDFSNELIDIPDGFSELAIESLKRSFSRFTLLKQDSINCKVLSISEVNLSRSIQNFSKSPQVFLEIRSEANSPYALIVINAQFASVLIDLILGGKGKSPETLRELSPVEQTIIEFLGINIFGELNNSIENSNFFLQKVSNNINTDFNTDERGAEIILDLSFGDISGTVTLLLPSTFITTLSAAQQNLFKENTPIERFNKFKKIADKVNLSILLGKTEISANDLPYLEQNDVILIERPYKTWEDSEFQESLNVYIGRGTNVLLKGNLQKFESEIDVLSEQIILDIQDIISEKDLNSQPKRNKMDTKAKQNKEQDSNDPINNESNSDLEAKSDNDLTDSVEASEETYEENLSEEQIDDESLATLENVMIKLRVNLGGRRISLKELQKIRVGQIIELGCRPNDPVEVVTDSDNKPIATGELIDIEGQLGVRLTKIFV